MKVSTYISVNYCRVILQAYKTNEMQSEKKEPRLKNFHFQLLSLDCSIKTKCLKNSIKMKTMHNLKYTMRNSKLKTIASVLDDY